MEKQQNDFSLLLASSVHDMKNSLNMLLNSLEELIEEYPPKNLDQQHRYGILQSESSRIRNDLIYLLGIYRYQRDELPIHIEEVFVEEFLQQQIALNSLLFQVRELQVGVECDPDMAAYFDEELVGGVINNILVNAAKYTAKSIQIKVEKKDGFLVIRVIDDGSGYPEAMIREPQAYRKPIDFFSGSTNLGLLFASQIAAMHRRDETEGHISVENLAVGGGCFSLYLP